MLYGLDLFSGIGGITLALQDWVKPIAYCENNKYCQAVLLSRMQSGEIPLAPICDDVRMLRKESFDKRTPINVISAGFPCQDISLMGTGRGLEGDRSGLYFELRRIISELRPEFVFLENVPAITLRGLEQITMDFTSMGFDSRWTIISAQEVGAVHIRERWFMLAHTNSLRLRKECRAKDREKSYSAGKIQSDGSSFERTTSESSARIAQPRVVRTGDGIPNKMDRAHALGNAVVPAQAKKAFIKLMGIFHQNLKGISNEGD